MTSLIGISLFLSKSHVIMLYIVDQARGRVEKNILQHMVLFVCLVYSLGKTKANRQLSMSKMERISFIFY